MFPLTDTALPLVIEFTADATGVGKTLAAWRTRYHCDLAGIATTMVRIETRGVAQRLRRGDIFIPVENFAQAAQRPGGIAGVLAPLSAAIANVAHRRSVVIVDWAGGLAQHHVAHLVATHFDEQLTELGVTGLSFVVTTNRTEQMRQAAGLAMPEVVRSTPAEFAKKTGHDLITSAACVTEVAAFWDLSEQALNSVFRFRAGSAR